MLCRNACPKRRAVNPPFGNDPVGKKPSVGGIHLFAWGLFLVFVAAFVIGGFLWLTRRGTGLDR